MFDGGGVLRGESAMDSAADVRAVTSSLASLDCLDDAQRIDLIRELESLKGAAAAAQARLAVAFADSQEAVQAAGGVPAPECGKGVAAQIALARRESPHRGSRHLGFARAMVHEMPQTLAHLTAGRVSEWRATILCRETAALSVEDRREVDRRLSADLPSMGDAQVERAAKGLAAQLDPGSVARRASKAAVERCVSLRPAPDTMTYLSGLLPIGSTDEPAEVEGQGPISAETARTLVSASAESEAQVWFRRMLTTLDGTQLIGLESRRRLFPKRLKRFLVLRDKTCRTPWCDAPIRHADHVVGASRDGPTNVANGQGLCLACNQVKEAHGWSAHVVDPGPQGLRGDVAPHRVRLRTPTGHSYDSTAPPVLEARRGDLSRHRARPDFSWIEHLMEVRLAAA